MQCPVCSTPNPPGMRFCTSCGHPFAAGPAQGGLKCPACGQAVKTGSRFCSSCGQPLATTPGSPVGPGRSEMPAMPPGHRPAAPSQGPVTSSPFPAAQPPLSAPQQPGPAPGPRGPFPAAIPGRPAVTQAVTAPRKRGPAFFLRLMVALALMGGAGYLGWKRFFRATPAPAGAVAEAQTPGQPAVEAGAAGQVPSPQGTQPSMGTETGRRETERSAGRPQPVVASQRAPSSTPPAGARAAGAVASARGGTQAGSPQTTAEIAQARSQGGPQSEAPVPAAASPSEPAGAPQPATPTASPASQAAQRPTILRPEPEIPPVKPREEAPPKPSKAEAPTTGLLIWTGALKKGEVVTIEGDRASTGMLRGALPGVPVMIETEFRGIGFTEMPGPSNGWKRLAFRSLRDQNVVVTLRWRTF